MVQSSTQHKISFHGIHLSISNNLIERNREYSLFPGKCYCDSEITTAAMLAELLLIVNSYKAEVNFSILTHFPQRTRTTK